MKLILLLFLISTYSFAVQPWLFPEFGEEFAIYCSSQEEEKFEKFAEVNEKGKVVVVTNYWDPCVINEYWGSEKACFTGEAQLVVGFINYGDGNYAFGMSDEDWYERAYVTEGGDTVRAYMVDGPNEGEEEVFIMDRCQF